MPNDSFATPEDLFPLDNGCQTKIIHTASTRVIYDYAYEFKKLAKNKRTAKSIFLELQKYFIVISTNLTLFSYFNMWIGRLKAGFQGLILSTIIYYFCSRPGKSWQGSGRLKFITQNGQFWLN